MSSTQMNPYTMGKYLLPMFFVAAATASHTASADIYMYTDNDGTRWLTNTSIKGKNAKLIARTPKSERRVERKTKTKTKGRPVSERTVNGSTGFDPGYAPSSSPELTSADVGGSSGAGMNSCLRLSHAQIEKRTAPHLSTIRKYSQTYGVEENLVRAVIRQESCFNDSARSHVGASGLMQLMPGTADMMGVTDIHDPQQNIRGGAKYLSQMLRRFDGDKQLALAAYNAGPGAVAKHGGVPPYRETRDYVVKVLSEYKRLEKREEQVAPVSYARSGFQNASLNRHQGADFSVESDSNDSIANNIYVGK